MSHPLLLALFATTEAAADGARRVHALGIDSQDLSIVARSHEEESSLSKAMDGTPGADIEDSPIAARLGELGGRILAAIAIVMPGIGPIVAGGPLAAELGEAAGHAAGSIETVLLGVHVRSAEVALVREALEASGASDIETARWG